MPDNQVGAYTIWLVAVHKQRQQVLQRSLGLNNIGRIRLSVSTASRTYELSEETHLTPFGTYRFPAMGLFNSRPYGRTYRRTTCCRYGLMACKYWAQSKLSCTCGRVSRGVFPRVRRYGLLYLWTGEYDRSFGLNGGRMRREMRCNRRTCETTK